MKGRYLDTYTVPPMWVETDYIPREAARILMYHKQAPLTEYDLNDLHAARVKPIVSGTWVHNGFGAFCSECKCYAYRDKFDHPWESPFCPNCGADMREDDGE